MSIEGTVVLFSSSDYDEAYRCRSNIKQVSCNITLTH